jgi:hypothetical protein
MSDDDPYPLLAGDDVTRPQCATCKGRCGEPGEFLVLEAGAILHADDTRQDGGPDDLMSAYLALVKHGAEPAGPYVRLDLVRDLTGGQADLLFCSGPCLRQFLNDAVDELERRWEREVRPASPE